LHLFQRAAELTLIRLAEKSARRFFYAPKLRKAENKITAQRSCTDLRKLGGVILKSFFQCSLFGLPTGRSIL
jgi:hypothetical protein